MSSMSSNIAAVCPTGMTTSSPMLALTYCGLSFPSDSWNLFRGVDKANVVAPLFACHCHAP
eukprot:3738430-Amphidinium_carterae.1